MIATAAVLTAEVPSIVLHRSRYRPRLLGLSEDPESGQLQLVLEQPQIPITDYALDLFGGRNAILRTPPFCGTYPTTAAFTPWDEALGTQQSEQYFEIRNGPGGGPCLGEAKLVNVKLNPETVLADGKSQTRATIEITDAEGVGIPNRKSSSPQAIPANV